MISSMQSHPHLHPIIQTLCQERLPQPTGHPERLKNLPDVHAVLFDIYGTLFVSGSGDVGITAKSNSAEAFLQALDVAGLAGRVCRADAETGGRAVQAYLASIDLFHQERKTEGIDYPEVDIREVWKRVWTALHEEGLVASASLETRELESLAMAYECLVNPVWPMPDACDVLERIDETGVVTGIVSNAQFFTPLLFPALMHRQMHELGFTENLCVYSFACREAKPSIALFEKALNRLEVDFDILPEQTLYVGNDMRNDIWPAAIMRCQTALFAGDKRSLRLRQDDDRVAGVQPDIVLTSLQPLLGCLSLDF